jgi:hypothetical protein
MTPPTSGPYKGLLIYEAIGLPSKAMAFNASPASAWSGLIYLPSRNMTMNAQSLSVNNKLTMVFNRLTLNSSDWTLDFDMDNKLKSYSLENIRLTQ